jgi:hypothetical protein
MSEREQHEDAFIRAEGALEVAFRMWLRASARNTGPIMCAAIKRGANAYRELRLAAAQLTHGVKR